MLACAAARCASRAAARAPRRSFASKSKAPPGARPEPVAPPPAPSPEASTATKLARLGAYVGVVGGGYALLVANGFLPAPLAADEPEALDAAPPQADVTERVFMDVAVGDAPPRRVVFGLYGSVAPRTAENFAELCGSSNAVLGYRNSKFHRVIPRFMIQGGDFTRGDGTGGTSIYGGTFPDENFDLRHAGAGALSMANRGPDTNSSQFFVTLRATPHLDGKHVVFGCVVDGFDAVRAVEAAGSRSGRTAAPVRVLDCGRLPRTRAEAEAVGRSKYGASAPGLVEVRRTATSERPLVTRSASPLAGR